MISAPDSQSSYMQLLFYGMPFGCCSWGGLSPKKLLVFNRFDYQSHVKPLLSMKILRPWPFCAFKITPTSFATLCLHIYSSMIGRDHQSDSSSSKPQRLRISSLEAYWFCISEASVISFNGWSIFPASFNYASVHVR